MLTSGRVITPSTSQSDKNNSKEMLLPKLLLFFDINKTILVKDTGSGKGTLASLNSILSECTWGRFNANKPISDRDEKDWVIVSESPSASPPLSADSHLSDFVSFGNFLEEHTKVPKSKQKVLKTNYTAEDGVGAVFSSHYQQIVDHLSLPFPPSSSSSQPLPDYFSDGFYHILPSFFRFIDFLVQKRVDFRVVFRTFGQDGGNVVDEFNSYCEARHPFLRPSQRLDGTDQVHPIDLRLLLPHQSASLARTSDKEEGLHLSYVDPNTQLVTIQTGAKAFYRTLFRDLLLLDQPSSSACSTPKSFLLRDDFAYWFDHHESDDSGKIMLINEKNPERVLEDLSEDVVQIFFDDNIERNFSHIVDVRDVDSFAPIPFSRSKDRFIRRVEPWSIITDEDYYIHLLRGHLKQYYQIDIDRNREEI